MKHGIRIENGYENGEFFLKIFGAKNELLLSLPEGNRKYQGHSYSDGKLYVGIYDPEIGVATYEFTDDGLVLKETINH